MKKNKDDKKLKVILATNNPGKVREIKRILRGAPVQLLSLADFKNIRIPRMAENGRTFAENALKKARTIARWSGMPALADDSGLEIAALGGRPGLKSARFAGPGASHEQLCRKVLHLMKNIPGSKRSARFVCLAALVWPDGRSITRTGYCRGFISETMIGQNGFGYDPVFYFPPLGKNFGELPLARKNKVSHRRAAFEKIAGYLKNVR